MGRKKTLKGLSNNKNPKICMCISFKDMNKGLLYLKVGKNHTYHIPVIYFS